MVYSVEIEGRRFCIACFQITSLRYIYAMRSAAGATVHRRLPAEARHPSTTAPSLTQSYLWDSVSYRPTVHS